MGGRRSEPDRQSVHEYTRSRQDPANDPGPCRDEDRVKRGLWSAEPPDTGTFDCATSYELRPHRTGPFVDAVDNRTVVGANCAQVVNMLVEGSPRAPIAGARCCRAACLESVLPFHGSRSPG